MAEPTPAIQLIQARKELTKYKQLAEGLETALRQGLIDQRLKSISKDELNSQYDADNPTAIQDFLNSKKDAFTKEVDTILADITSKADEYVANEFADDKVAMQSALAQYNASKGSNLTYEQLTTDVPPRIIKQFENGELSTMDDLFDASVKFLSDTGLYKPNTPPNTNTPDTPAHGGDNTDPLGVPQDGVVEDEFY